jgi:hypothetical protein
VGVQEAKPPEADEFLHVKGVFSLIQDNEHIKKMGKKFQTGGGAGAVSAFALCLKHFSVVCNNI